MRKSGLVLPLVIIAIACSGTKQTTKIDVATGISISIPQTTNKIKKDSTAIFYLWETSFDDDQFAVYRYPIIQSDSFSFDSRKKAFRNNIDAFIQTFTFKKIDSIYLYKDDNFQCNLNFDFLHDNDDYRFFGRFLINKNYFIDRVSNRKLPDILNVMSKSF